MEVPYQSHNRSGGGSTPISRSRRTWTGNGVQFSMETATYASPGLTFETINSGANSPFDDFLSPGITRRQTAPTTATSNGLFGTALGLLGGLASIQQSDQQHSAHRGRQAGTEQVEQDVDMADVDATSVNDCWRTTRPKSLFSRFVSRMAENGPQARGSTTTREPSQAQGQARYWHDSSCETDIPSWTQQTCGGFFEQPVQHEYHSGQHPWPDPGSNSASDDDVIAAMERLVQNHANEVKRCKKQLERASRQRQIHSGHLQALLDELKSNESALANVVQCLQMEKDNARRRRPSRLASRHVRASGRRQHSERFVDGDDDLRSSNDFDPFEQLRPQHLAAHTLFHNFALGDMDPFATMFGGGIHDHSTTPGDTSSFDDFFHMPGSTFNPTSNARTRPPRSQQRQQDMNYASSYAPPAPAKPPATLLTPDEARQLFKMYNDRWNTLPLSDANIPYPSRGLHATALLSRDTLWAPDISVHPSMWSDDAAMQANIQAFFLNVVGLVPEYTEAQGTGSIQMGFDQTSARPEQVKKLLDILKKEKTRWHSDRLGRRNGGASGCNEALQQDERARAVFHAVCELMETAQ